MKKLFNQVTRSEWREDEYCMPIIARFGTGGGNMPIVLESNQNHATVGETEVCPTLPASMGLGGGYVPMIVETLVFDQTQITSKENGCHPQWGGRCHPLAANAYPPTVIIRYGEDNELSRDNGGADARSASRKL